MPELPEVETTRLGITPLILHHTIDHVTVRQRQLRWPIPRKISTRLPGKLIHSVDRRGKYLLLHTDNGTLIIHLGMSGSLRVVPTDSPAQAHDHFDLGFTNGQVLRLRDPRRFGCVLWSEHDPLQHELLADLGVEPLSTAFNAEYMQARARNRKVAIKQFIMNSHIVVGVGNIYANEALFNAGIHPSKPAGSLSHKRMQRLVEEIKMVLHRAIASGGTTLRDFTSAQGAPGYFQQQLSIYNREGQACVRCGAMIKCVQQGQRSTYYCGKCQR